MRKRRDLVFCSGKLSEQDSTWDVLFWQSVSTEERFRATCELLRIAYKLKNGAKLPTKIDKTHVVIGSYR